MADIPELSMVTIEGVELASTGWWDFSTGPRELTADHLKAAVDALEDKAIRSPKIKIGHTDPRFDGDPLLGSVTNLRLSENGQTIIGDYVIAPALAPLVAKSPEQEGEAPYAKRSIEGQFGYKTKTGNEHAFVLTAVALLGDQDPAIEDLADVIGMFTNTGDFLAAASSTKAETGQKIVNAGAVMDRIRWGVFDEIPGDDQPWDEWDAWVRKLEVDSGSSGFLIIEDGFTDKLFRVTWTVDGDEISYGEPEEVIDQYVAASKQASQNSIRFPRESNRVRGNAVTLPETATAGRKAQEANVTPEQLKKLGLPEDADQATIDAKLDELTKAKAEETPPPEGDDDSKPDDSDADDDSKPEETPEAVAAGKLPEGVVAIDKATLEEMKAQAKAGAEARERQRVEDRDRYLMDAIKAGKFPRSRKDHYAAMYDADEAGTKKLIDDDLQAGTIPVKEIGHDGGTESTEDAGYPDNWLTASERKRITAGQGAN